MTDSKLANSYIFLVILIGWGILGWGILHWHSPDPWLFAVIAAFTLPASCMKVRLPGVTGSMSVQFPFLLAGFALLHLSESLVLCAATTIVQTLWRAQRRPKLVHLLFNVACVPLAGLCAYATFHAPLLPDLGLRIPVRLLVAAGVFFLANTLPVAGVIALTERKPLRQVWLECYLWSLPYYLVAASLVGVAVSVDGSLGWQGLITLVPPVAMVYVSYRSHIGRLESQREHAESQQRHAEEMAKLHLRTIQTLALAIEAKDQTTHEHLARVQVYAVEVGRELGLTGPELEALRAAALLHDIGKLAVPEHIISKPGKLTPEEFEKMKIHPVVGAELVERVQFPYPVAPIVRGHHERWDGSGYPDGLKGEMIPIGARILAAVDTLDALASDRQYRRALPLDDAMQVVVRDSGRLFDPRVVEVLHRRYQDLEREARTANTMGEKLSTDVRVERGVAPAAGFEETAASARTAASGAPADVIATIAAARQEAQTLFELSQELGNSLSVSETSSVLAVRLRPLIPFDAMAVWVRDKGRLLPAFVSGDDHRLFSSLEIPVGQGLSGWVAENRQPVVNGNPSVEPGYLGDPGKFSMLRSALAVPLEGLNGVVGVLSLYRSESNAFSRDHVRMLQAISSKLALSVENAQRYHQARESATTDFLTGLPNARSLFIHLETELAHCRRNGQPLSVLVCDLDQFKTVNDRFGHLEGNRVLRMAARAIRDACRQEDYVARMGGDEFVAILPGMSAAQAAPQAEQLRERVLSSFGDIGVGGLSLSVGHASWPEHGPDSETLLAHADRIMYHAKQARNGNAWPADRPAQHPVGSHTSSSQ